MKQINLPKYTKTDVSGKRVLLRVDLNVPIEGRRISDTFRITKALPTIEELRSFGAKVIILAHIESENSNNSLKPVAEYLKMFFPLTFVSDIFSKEAEKLVNSMKDGDVVFFENLRKDPGEKKNDPVFAKKLAAYGEVYINEGFSVSHREHASVVGLPKLLPSFAGPQFVREVENISRALDPKHPFLFVLGGAKFSTKIPLLRKFLKKADAVCVAGALMNTFFKVQGFEIGKSVVDNEYLDISDMLSAKNLYLPKDLIVTDGKETKIVEPDKVLPEDKIMDIGPETILELQAAISDSSFILWNGPVGNYEAGFEEGTLELAHRIAESGKDSIIGGGDTVASISKLHLEDKFSFVSTGGGAMLDLLVDETLPGIEALVR